MKESIKKKKNKIDPDVLMNFSCADLGLILSAVNYYYVQLENMYDDSFSICIKQPLRVIMRKVMWKLRLNSGIVDSTEADKIRRGDV